MKTTPEKTNGMELLNYSNNQETKSPEEKLIHDSTVTNERFSPFLRQCLAAAGPTVCTVGAGMTSGYSAILLPQLKMENSLFRIDEEMSSWIASVVALPMAVGCILAGWLIEKFGRKYTHFIISIPFIFGWILIGFSTHIYMLLAGRFITGFCIGLLGPSCAIYIGEVSDPKYRGILLAGVSLAISVGLFCVHLLGTFLSWPVTALLSALCPVICFLIMLFVPESPSWLAKKNRLKEAEESFKWLRGCNEAALNEMDAMFRKQQEVEEAAKITTPPNILQQLLQPELWKPLLIINLYFCTTQFSGVNAVAFYSVKMIKETIGGNINEYLVMMIIDTLRVFMSLTACILTRKLGRRPLTLFSGLGTAAFLIILGTNSFLASQQAWIAMTAFIGYIVFISIGLVPLPWILIGEVYPLAARGFCSGLTSGAAFFSCFIVLKTLPAMFRNFGPGGTYLFYGSIALTGTIILYIFLPETRNKTLQNIEEHFASKNRRNDPKKEIV